MIREDSVASARRLARELSAEFIVGGPATEAAVERLVARAGHGPRVDLHRLGAAVTRAELVADRTRRRAAARVVRTLNTDLAIHPDTLRQASAALLAAADRCTRAERRTGPSVAGRVRLSAALAVAVAGGVVAVLGAAPLGLAIAAAGVFAALVTGQVARWNRRRQIPALAAAEADRAGARRRWVQLVGPDTDPRQVEAIIHRFDPQHELVAHLVDQHPAVRAADQVAAMRRRSHAAGRRTIEADQAGQADQPGTPAGVRAPVPTVVVASPYVGLTEERSRALHRRLLTLPPGLRVVVVLAPGLSTADERVVDLTDRADSGPLVPVDRLSIQAPPPR